jgi:5-deoxy-glucuronate isomerase
MNYNQENLNIHAAPTAGSSLLVEVTPEIAGWELIHFQSHQLAAGQTWTFAPGAYELAVVVLSGTLSVQSNRGEWRGIGKRASVFEGLPEALYLPIHSNLTVTADSDCQFAVAWVPARREHPPRLIRQSDITVEIRGGDNATRHINGIIRPGFDCEHLVLVEVYTPSGNWSSYPPHKHDVLIQDENGKVLEADLEEIYYYKISPPDGYAIQRVYTDETSPLHKAGAPIDALLLLRNDDIALIPEGYHPVVSAPGYTTYYLNVLAGSHQALTALDDPQFTWVKNSYQSKDPRVPIFPVDPRQLI